MGMAELGQILATVCTVFQSESDMCSCLTLVVSCAVHEITSLYQIIFMRICP